MSQNMVKDLRAFLEILRREDSLLEISTPVDPYLEIAEIHRRVIAQGGPALLFERPTGHSMPVLGNLFKTQKRGNSKTELVLMIVPYIIETDGQAEELAGIGAPPID